MITEIEKVITTQESHPFATAVHKLAFAENGYAEDEYFIHGTANVYTGESDNDLKIMHQSVPYCNRILIRRPSDYSKISGNIIVEILNSTADFDIDRIWIVCGKELMRNGAVYIGITSKPNVLKSLKDFDGDRYNRLSWEISYAGKNIYGKTDNKIFNDCPENCEMGLFWDMLTDLALLLRTDTTLFSCGKQRKLILAGWSQSVSYMATYTKYFVLHKQNEKIFDGYLAAGGVHNFETPLNQAEYGKNIDPASLKLSYMPVPYIAVQTETENAKFGGREVQQEDSDGKTFLYRLYELPGPTHDTKYSLLDYYHDDADLLKIHMLPQYVSADPYPNDYPYQFVFAAVMRFLLNWVRDGVLPPHASRIPVDAGLNNKTDEFGNAAGGVRSPFVDVPVCTYCNYSSLPAKHGSENFNYLFGHIVPFSGEQLHKLYGTLKNYTRLVERSADTQTFLLSDDKEDAVKEAVENAKKWGLV